ncbi:hypothetical protein BJ741DRAFT_715098, partial [Chytriomyces cf. hyalinus JEL632]
MSNIPAGYEVRRIRPNGNCFFAAIAYSLSVGRSNAEVVSPGVIRRRFVAHLLEIKQSGLAEGATDHHQSELLRIPQLTGFESIDDLIDALNDDGTEHGWGSTDFLVPLGEILRVQFIMYSPHLGGGQDLSMHPQFRTPPGNLQTVRLAYSENHFDAVVERNAVEHPIWATIMSEEDSQLQSLATLRALENSGTLVEHFDKKTPSRTTDKKQRGIKRLRRSKRLAEAEDKKMKSSKGVGVGVRGSQKNPRKNCLACARAGYMSKTHVKYGRECPTNPLHPLHMFREKLSDGEAKQRFEQGDLLHWEIPRPKPAATPETLLLTSDSSYHPPSSSSSLESRSPFSPYKYSPPTYSHVLPWPPMNPYFDASHPTVGSGVFRVPYQNSPLQRATERNKHDSKYHSDYRLGTDDLTDNPFYVEGEKMDVAWKGEGHSWYWDSDDGYQRTSNLKKQTVETPKYTRVSSFISTLHARQHKRPSLEQQRLYRCLDNLFEQCDQITYEASALANIIPVLIMDGNFDHIPAYGSLEAEALEGEKLRMHVKGGICAKDRQMLHLREVVGAELFFRSCMSLVSKFSEKVLVSMDKELKFLEGRTSSKSPIMMEAARRYLQKRNPELPIPHRRGLANIITAESARFAQDCASHISIHFFQRLSNFMVWLLQINIPELEHAIVQDETSKNVVVGISFARLAEVFLMLVEDGGVRRYAMSLDSVTGTEVAEVLLFYEGRAVFGSDATVLLQIAKVFRLVLQQFPKHYRRMSRDQPVSMEVGLDPERIGKDWASFLPLNKWLIDLQADQAGEQVIPVIPQPRVYDGECKKMLKDIIGADCTVSPKKIRSFARAMADSINCKSALQVPPWLDTSNLDASRLSAWDRIRIFTAVQEGVARVTAEIDAGTHFPASYKSSSTVRSFTLLPMKDSNRRYVGLNPQILCDILRGHGFDSVSIIGEKTFPNNKPRHDISVKVWEFAFDFQKLPPMVPKVPLPNVKYSRFYLQTNGVSCTHQTEIYSHSTFDSVPHLRKSLDLSQVSPDDDVDAIDPGTSTIATGVNLRDLRAPYVHQPFKNKIHCGLGSQVLGLHGGVKKTSPLVQDNIPTMISNWTLQNQANAIDHPCSAGTDGAQERFHPISISREEYYQVTGMTDAKRRREFLRKKEGPLFQEMQTGMPSCKTTNLETLLEYVQYSSQYYQVMHDHHKKLRKLKFTQKVRWRIGMGVLIKKLCRGRKNRVFLVGDAGEWFGGSKVSKNLKGNRKAPTQKFWREVRLHPWVKGIAMVNEWGTSKTCCDFRSVENMRRPACADGGQNIKIHSVLRCKTCTVVWNRDVLAAMNILVVGLHLILGYAHL